MAKKDWLTKLNDLEGAVTERYNPHNNVVRTPSPSVNFCFGNGHGLPRGSASVFFGPPKGGKTVLVNSMVGQLHQDDPEAFVIKFDTEFRELTQNTDPQVWGIDPSRYIVYSVNSPVLIFDRITKDILPMLQDGLPLAMLIIDSITGVQGRRSIEHDSILDYNIGDQAQTLQLGFMALKPVQAQYRFAVALTAHVRAELNMLEQKRGNVTRMAAAFGVQHYAEYFMYIEPNRNKEGKTDIDGNEFVNDNLKDMNDRAERTGHKIRTCMKDSSCGPKGRFGEFTLDYRKGIINVYEEVYRLGIGRGIIERPNQVTFVFKDRKWVGKQSLIDSLKNDTELQQAILKELRAKDVAGAFAAEDAKAELAMG